MSRKRVLQSKQLTKREKKIKKRLQQRKHRNDIINSLSSNKPVSQDKINKLTPSMKKFMSKIPSDPLNSSKLTSWPSYTSINTSQGKNKSKSTRQKNFEDARKGLEDILKKKPIYENSKSVIKFSDYKSKKKNKQKGSLKAKSKYKGSNR